MATQAQILANRSNAQKSTGPRTPEGKAVVAQNAVQHGLTGTETVITGEDLGEFEFYRERMLAELDPAGEVEAGLAERIVGLSWRLKRAERLQTAAFDSLYARQKEHFCEKSDKDAEGDAILGGAIVRDFANCRVLDRLLMYERRIEHSLYRTMAELKRHRILQQVGPGGMWELRRALASEDEARTENHGRDARATKVPAEDSAKASEASPSVNEARMGNPGQDARATKTPAGGTAGDEGRATQPAAETLHDLSCKTKPICPSPDHGQVSFDEGVTPDATGDGARETKPIGEVAMFTSHPSEDSRGRQDRPTGVLCREGRSP